MFNNKKSKLGIALLLFLVANSIFAQELKFGGTPIPFTGGMSAFDKPYFIYEYSSMEVPTYFESYYPVSIMDSWFSGGIFLEYLSKNKSYLGKIELDYIPLTYDYFYYSAVQVPILFGIKLRKNKTFCPSLYIGINNEFGKFTSLTWGGLLRRINKNKLFGGFATEDFNKKANYLIIKNIPNYMLYFNTDIKVNFYQFSFGLRFQRNISTPYKINYKNNANVKKMYCAMITMAYTFKYGKNSPAYQESTPTLLKNE